MARADRSGVGRGRPGRGTPGEDVADRLFTIRSGGVARHRVERSLFIGEAHPIRDRTGAAEVLGAVRARYPDAAHYPHAFRAWAGGDILEHASDDGEPNGTGGCPILDALRSGGLVGVCLVVVRHFGGRKLGTRRLTASFGRAAELSLAEAGRVELIRCRMFEIRFPFDLTGPIHVLVERLGGRIEERLWDGGGEILAGIPSEHAEEARARLTETLRDRGVLRVREGETLLSP